MYRTEVSRETATHKVTVRADESRVDNRKEKKYEIVLTVRAEAIKIGENPRSTWGNTTLYVDDVLSARVRPLLQRQVDLQTGETRITHGYNGSVVAMRRYQKPSAMPAVGFSDEEIAAVVAAVAEWGAERVEARNRAELGKKLADQAIHIAVQIADVARKRAEAKIHYAARLAGLREELRVQTLEEIKTVCEEGRKELSEEVPEKVMDAAFKHAPEAVRHADTMFLMPASAGMVIEPEEVL